MKNILIIKTSPRKGGNSDMLADEFAAGAIEAGNTVETRRTQHFFLPRMLRLSQDSALRDQR